ncbi:MAG: hypothetical protein M3Y18_09725, partial [Candidatus Eremiobacteraeota bacterium]|nr:hypothetical protein [Candidatus Eremiobacteraeota bacterium]
DGLIEFNHDSADGEARLLSAARDAVESNARNPAKYIVESVLSEKPAHPDDVAALTIFFK